jgi:hypothetical protein
MTPDERAARIADAQALLDILRADESLPLASELKHLGFYFRAGDMSAPGARRELAALEAAIPAEFDDGHADENGGDWIVTGVMPGGVKVTLHAWARDVARKVTVVKEAEVNEWVRLPVEDEAPESGEQA